MVSNVIYHHCVKPAFAKEPLRATPQGNVYCKPDAPVVGQFVKYLAHKLNNGHQTTGVKVAVLRALTNTAHPEAIKVLKPILTGEEPLPEFYRVQSVANMHRALICHKEVNHF